MDKVSVVELFKKSYTPKKVKMRGLIKMLKKEWRGIPNEEKSTGYRKELSLNEILFEYHILDEPDNTITVKQYRKMDKIQRLRYVKGIKKNGFVTLVLTMRNRHHLVNEPDISGTKYPGLKSLLKEWSEQESKPYLPDSVLRILLSNDLTNRPDYVVVARIELVRRIRKGTKIGAANLIVAEQLLKLATDEFPAEKYENDGEWIYTCPNSLLKAALELQNALNLGRKNNYQATIKSCEKVRKLVELEERFEFKNIYLWWTHLIELRTVLSMGLRNNIRDIREMKENIEKNSDDTLKTFFHEIQPNPDENDERGSVYDLLKKYHDGLCLFRDFPSCNLTSKKNWKVYEDERSKHSVDDKWSKNLMYAIVGASHGKNKHDRISIKKLDGKLDTRDEIHIIKKVETAIDQSYWLVDAVMRRNSHLTTIKLLLVVIDVFARIRWALGQEKMIKWKEKGDCLIEWVDDLKKELPDLKEWGRNYGSSKHGYVSELRKNKRVGPGKNKPLLCPTTKRAFAEKIKDDLSKFLVVVETHMNNHSINNNDTQMTPFGFIKNCIESLETYSLDGDEYRANKRTSFGELAHLCGAFIGFPMATHPFESKVCNEVNERVLVLNGYQRKSDNQEKYLLESDIEYKLKIESNGHFSPYVPPAGEARAAHSSHR